MVDILYILGSGSRWEDNELRYSLRSIEKHAKNYNRIFLAGKKPDWIINVEHIAVNDPFKCKERNIMNKIKVVCENSDISDNFLFLNDDHFALKDFDASEFPNYQKGSLPVESDRYVKYSNYYDSMLNTSYILKKMNLPIKHYDIHVPMIFNKYLFPKINKLFDWANTPNGFVVKSIYANTLSLESKFMNDLKIDSHYDEKKIKSLLIERKFFSIGDRAIGPELIKILCDLYPEKSKYER